MFTDFNCARIAISSILFLFTLFLLYCLTYKYSACIMPYHRHTNIFILTGAKCLRQRKHFNFSVCIKALDSGPSLAIMSISKEYYAIQTLFIKILVEQNESKVMQKVSSLQFLYRVSFLLQTNNYQLLLML